MCQPAKGGEACRGIEFEVVAGTQQCTEANMGKMVSFVWVIILSGGIYACVRGALLFLCGTTRQYSTYKHNNARGTLGGGKARQGKARQEEARQVIERQGRAPYQKYAILRGI